MKNPKVLAFYIVAIIIIVAVAILALTVSGNSGAFLSVPWNYSWSSCYYFVKAYYEQEI